jgi:hypothetical protein
MAAEDLQYCPVTLFHDSQLDEHGICPPRSPTFTGRVFEAGPAPASELRV